jgi:hypothetical protein
LDWFDQRLSRGRSDFNVGRTIVINGSWQLPNLKSGPRPVTWAVNGWQLGGIYKASDGIPFMPTFGSNGDVLGKNSSNTYAYPNLVTGSGCDTLVNPGNPTNYIKTQCFAVPTAPSPAFYTANCNPGFGSLNPIAPNYLQCFNLRGNAGRNVLTGPGLSEFDFSMFKNNYIRRISEAFNVQFRAEIFNLFNRTNFAPPPTPTNTDIFDASGLTSGSAGLLTSTTTTAREVQFALKVIW